MSVLSKKEMPVVGCSPGNPYFTVEKLTWITQTLLSEFEVISFFIPDVPAIHTYKGLGYSVSKARRKAILRGNSLKNKIESIRERLNIPNDKIIIPNWLEIEKNASYKISEKKIVDLYQSNTDFKQACLSTTKQALNTYQFSETRDADEAVFYLLKELIFLDFAARFFSVESVTYVYHKSWPVYENLITGTFDNIKKANQKFRIISI